MSRLCTKTKFDDYKRGLIYFVDFGSVKNSEDHVQRKVRPAIIVSDTYNNFYSKTVTVVPLTTKEHKELAKMNCEVAFKRWHSGTVSRSIALVNQLTTVNKFQCSYSIGKLDKVDMDTVSDVVRKSLVV